MDKLLLSEVRELKDYEFLNAQMDFFFEVMAKDTDVFVADGDGVVVRINQNYVDNYGVTENEIVGKRVEDLEGSGVFWPSVTRMVLKERKKVTVMQKNRRGDDILTTGVPLFDESGAIRYVVSFPAIDIADISDFNQKYRALNQLVSKYTWEIERLNGQRSEFFGMFTNNNEMRRIYSLIEDVSGSNANVLITGETGTGKSLLASLIHSQSTRKDKPFVEINCAAIPRDLVASELFGYVPGAFSGASDSGQSGKIEAAGGGTLFLDEIGELTMEMQKNFLQVVQDKRITRVGGTVPISVDFRLITATNRDLEERIRDKRFREDLYYRLKVVPIHIPALRERKEDILMLTMQFLERFNRLYAKNRILTQQGIDLLRDYYWPGNIRQLQNVIERIVIMAPRDVVDEWDLQELFADEDMFQNRSTPLTLKEKLELYEKKLIMEAFARGGSTAQIAKELGVAQSSVVRKFQKYVPGYGGDEVPLREGK